MPALRVVTLLALVMLALAQPAVAQATPGEGDTPSPGAVAVMEPSDNQFVLTVRLENRGDAPLIVDAAADVATAAAGHERFHQDRCWVSTSLEPGEANEFTCLLPWGEGPYTLHGATWADPNATEPAANYSEEFFAPDRSVVMAVDVRDDAAKARPAKDAVVGAFPEDAAVLALELRNERSDAMAMVASSDNAKVDATVENPAQCVVTTTLNASETSRFRCPLTVEMGHYFLQTAAGPVETGNVTLSNHTLYRPTQEVVPFTLAIEGEKIHIR